MILILLKYYEPKIVRKINNNKCRFLKKKIIFFYSAKAMDMLQQDLKSIPSNSFGKLLRLAGEMGEVRECPVSIIIFYAIHIFMHPLLQTNKQIHH